MASVIDVSTYQGEISWSSVKSAGVQLAIIKATEGIGFVDPRFSENWAGAKAAGIARAAYHFAHPDAGNDPIAEAQYFLSVVQGAGLDPADLLAEDYEVPGGGAAWSLAFLSHVEMATNRTGIFYSNYSGISRVQDPRMAAFLLWLAYPGDGVNPPPVPAPWTSIALWQYAVGTVPGIAAGVDEDVSLVRFAAVPASVTSPTKRRPRMSATSDNHNVFIRGKDEALWHNRFDEPTQKWTGWQSLGGQLGDSEIEVTGSGQRLDVYVIGTDGGVWHIHSSDAGASWSAFSSDDLGGLEDGMSLVAVGPGAPAAPAAPVDLSPVLQAEAATLAAVKSISVPAVDQSAVLAAIADLKAHPSFDPNDATILAIVSRLESALKGA